MKTNTMPVVTILNLNKAPGICRFLAPDAEFPARALARSGGAISPTENTGDAAPCDRTGSVVSVSQPERERAALIHRACLSVSFHVEQHGRGMLKTVRRVARRYRGHTLKCDPARRIALAPGTLLHLYHRWQRGGKVPSALYRNWVSGRRYIDGALLVRFINFVSDNPFGSLRAAWLAFCERGGSYGPGRASGRKLALTYDALRWNLPRGCFAKILREWKAINQARKNIEALRAKFIDEIAARVPAKLPRRKGARVRT